MYTALLTSQGITSEEDEVEALKHEYVGLCFLMDDGDNDAKRNAIRSMLLDRGIDADACFDETVSPAAVSQAPPPKASGPTPLTMRGGAPVPQPKSAPVKVDSVVPPMGSSPPLGRVGPASGADNDRRGTPTPGGSPNLPKAHGPQVPVGAPVGVANGIATVAPPGLEATREGDPSNTLLVQLLQQQTEATQALAKAAQHPQKPAPLHSTIKVNPTIKWPELGDGGSGGKEVEEFYEKLEEIFRLANDGAGMPWPERLISLRSCLRGS